MSPVAPRPRPVPSNELPTYADLVPAPVSVEPVGGEHWTLTADTAVHTHPAPVAVAVAEHLAAVLRRATGHPVPVVADDGPGQIRLRFARDGVPEHGEGYRLDVTADGVTVAARTAAGLFHGTQTLRQLLPAQVEGGAAGPGPWTVPAGRVVDHPRFAYRGAMLDVARHFRPVADVLRFIDLIALYKINHLHLHLTDDQGWRIAIDNWPLLGEYGGAGEVGDGPGGHYSKADYRRIVEYAATRAITVVPEIDVPGHTNAALAAYAELSPDRTSPPRYTGTEVGFSALAVHSETTYDFLHDVFTEIAALTPGPYLHIGGDEAFKVPADDYATFMAKTQPLVVATGKTVMGWHQLAVTTHSPGRVVQFWGTSDSDDTVTDAVRRGARVVLSPANRVYLDMKYAPDTPVGHDWAGLLEVRDAYDWDPGSFLAGVPESAVLGVEAPLWTESVTTMAEVELMLFPRLAAVAELGWSPAGSRDWTGFARRLAAQAPRWTAAGITFHRSPQIPWPAAGDVPSAAQAPAQPQAT
ncbi:beta-N-acetylhexosaminidase [Polymorphospora sp. 2-325]|uniref:beta-N-acetylhexosaminidase n=1 Tax=Polymorphospora lycopeni TaxID=3140240 RepID=A0ABV5CPY0_9ACTN